MIFLNFPKNTLQEPKTEEEISKLSLSEEQEKKLAQQIFKVLEKYISIEDMFQILDRVKIIVLDKIKIQQQYEKKDEFKKGNRNDDKIL